MAERILDYGINHTGKAKDKIHRYMVINYANAIKLGGDKKRALTELHKLDWSATDLLFRISVAAVEEDVPKVLSLMSKAAKTEEITPVAYREWPVFRPLRDNTEFQEKFRLIYEEDLRILPKAADLTVAPEVASSETAKSEQQGVGEERPNA